MAGPTRPKGSSVITFPIAAGQPKTLVSRATGALRQIYFTAKDVAQPETLQRILTTLQTNIIDAIRPLLQNSMLTGNRLVNVPFTPSTLAQLIPHNLGRAYQGYYVVGDYNLGWTGSSIPYAAGGWPQGADNTKYIYLVSPVPGNWDFYVY